MPSSGEWVLFLTGPVLMTVFVIVKITIWLCGLHQSLLDSRNQVAFLRSLLETEQNREARREVAVLLPLTHMQRQELLALPEPTTETHL